MFSIFNMRFTAPDPRRSFDDLMVPIINCIWFGLDGDAGPLGPDDLDRLRRIFERGLPGGEHIRLIRLAVEGLHPGRLAWWQARPSIDVGRVLDGGVDV